MNLPEVLKFTERTLQPNTEVSHPQIFYLVSTQVELSKTATV